MRNYVFFISSLLCTFNVHAQLNWSWAKDGFSSGSAKANQSVMDAGGNVYVCGTFTAANSNNSDIFFAKYDQSGNVKWSRTARTGKIDEGRSIAVDRHGNVYVVGYFGKQYVLPIITDSIYFDSYYLPSTSGTADIFLAKYDSAGNALWATSMGSSLANDQGMDIIVDDSDNVYLTGFFGQTSGSITATFDTIALTSSADGDIFIAKLSSGGSVLWAKAGGGIGLDMGLSVDLDSTGNLYVGGSFANSAFFDQIQVNSISSGFYGGNGFVAKFTHWGSTVWAKPVGIIADPNNPPSTPAVLSLLDIAVNKRNEQVFITGSYAEGAIKFDNGSSLPNVDHLDIFLAGLDAAGNCQWIKNAGSTSEDGGHSTAVTDKGDIFLSGYYGYTIGFGNDTLAYSGGDDLFIASYDSYGNVNWAKSIAGSGFEKGLSVNINRTGTSVCLAGFVNGAPISFGSHTVNINGNSNYFIAKADLATSAATLPELIKTMSIFPNPTKGLVQVGHTATYLKLSVTDIYGRLVFETNNEKSNQFDFSHLPNGLYILTTFGKTISTAKMIINH